MTENQFLKELENALFQLPEEERKDILQDIQEYFSNGRSDGKTDSMVVEELGSPKVIAAELIESFDFSKTEEKPKIVDLSKDEFDKVDVQIENGKLEISPSEDGKMHVDVKDKSYKQQLFVDILDRTLIVTLKEEQKKWGIFSFTVNMKSPIVTVQLPVKVYEDIKLYSDNGSINGKKLKSTKFSAQSDNGRIALQQITANSFSAESDNGAISLESIQAGRLKAKTDNGKVEMEDIHANSTFIESDNGSLDMERVEGNIEAITDNGPISLRTDDLERNIRLRTDNGSISVRTSRKPENTVITAKVDWGSTSIFGKKSARSVFGDGRHSIDLKSDNGSITVKQA